MADICRTYRITGLVQGVGFRPTLWHTARRLGLRGTVNNDAQGVTAVLEGPAAVLDDFPAALSADIAQSAPLARIDSIEAVCENQAKGYEDFRIIESERGQAKTMVTPDAATCAACKCLQEGTPQLRSLAYILPVRSHACAPGIHMP